MKYGKLKEELWWKVGLSIGSERLRGKLNNLDGGRREILNSKELGKIGANKKMPQISGEGNESQESAISVGEKG